MTDFLDAALFFRTFLTVDAEEAGACDETALETAAEEAFVSDETADASLETGDSLEAAEEGVDSEPWEEELAEGCPVEQPNAEHAMTMLRNSANNFFILNSP
jgi:hypothetical protein